MCGILSVFSTSVSVDRDKLARATDAIIHRGPDGEGILISPNKKVGLGHRRLAIIDPKRGIQPIVSNDEGVAAVVNGELYDYKKIRASLKKDGYKFKTESDSEIVLYLYKKHGLNFVDYLRGEFAIVLFDQQKNIIIAARDRFGIKPLQYSLDAKGTLYIASEAKALFALGLKPAWDQYALAHSLTLQYLPQNRTLFDGVHQLPPASLLVYDGRKLEIRKYWDLNFPKTTEELNTKYNERQIGTRLESLLSESVAMRLQTDGARYCTHLSGGVDSGLISALATKLGQQKLHCFTISFPHKAYSEVALAKRVASHIGAKFTEVSVDPDSIIENFEKAIYFSEGLAINSHLIAKYILNREIRRQGYKVALTGEGSDESLAGYSHLKADLLGAATLDANTQNAIVSGVQFPVGQSLNLKIIKDKLGFVPTFLQAKGSIGYALRNLMRPDFKKQYPPQTIAHDFINSIDVKNQLVGRNLANQSSYLWIKFALANYILKTLGDGTEMASSIEGRVPFLDHKFFEFARTIPMSLKIKNNTQKYILRKIAKKYLPKEIYDRPKQTFMAPPLSLSGTKLGLSFLRDVFGSKEFAEMGFFDQKKVLALTKTLEGAELQKQITVEPVIMLMLSSFFIHKQFKLSS